MQRKWIGLLMLIMLWATLACATSPTPLVNGPTSTPSLAPSATLAADNVPSATATPSPTPGCVFGAAYVADVTVPDNTAFLPDTPFVKTWQLRNSGSCNWAPGTLLVYNSGDPLGGPVSVPLPAAAVGVTVDVNVNFVAPGIPGNYRSNWQAQTPDGTYFGGQFYVQIVVPEPTPQPTNTPQPTETPSPTATTAPPADWPLYRRGNSGAMVYAIQYLLRTEVATITVDGIFGAGTETAVKDFQLAQGLAADGIVGPQTWEALIKNHTLRLGDNGDAVRAAQYLLANVYGYGIAVDGVFGSGTKSVVQSFQTTHNLTSDGVVGKNTWKALVVGP